MLGRLGTSYPGQYVGSCLPFAHETGDLTSTSDYGVDPAKADTFYAQIRRYWPALPDSALQPGYAGIRPKTHDPGELAADFRIDGPTVHGVPWPVNLFSIKSPGLTSSLAIAERVAAILSAGSGA